MKYYIIAGEASGNLHGSNLMKSLKMVDPVSEFRFMGGDLMTAQGGKLVMHYRNMAYMGLDAIFHLKTVLQRMKFCKNDIISWRPDVIILIDFAGFNLPIAEFAHNKGIKTFYYISPKVWAWKESRVKKLKKFVDKIFVILPFEVGYFKKFQIDVEYHGNPLVDAIHEFQAKKSDFNTFIKNNNLDERPIIAIVAGSRFGEIKRLLPEMIKAIGDKIEYQLVIAGAPAIPLDFYKKFIAGHNIKIVFGQTYELISNSTLAIVTSGTATLETAMLKTPEVVVFKTHPITYFIGRSLVKIEFFSLVNLIMQRQVVKELLQFHLADNILKEVDKIITNDLYREKMLHDFDTIERMLGKQGVSDRIAQKMATLLR